MLQSSEAWESWCVGQDAAEWREQQGEIRHWWKVKLGILSAYNTGDVRKVPILDLLIPSSSDEELLEPEVLWWAAVLRSNESLGPAKSHPKMWKEFGNETTEQPTEKTVSH